MSDLRLSDAPKEQPRRGQCRELAPSLTGVTSVLELEAKILLAVSSWPKDVHERLLPGAFPAHVEIPALNNNEFEAHQRQPEEARNATIQSMLHPNCRARWEVHWTPLRVHPAPAA